LENEGTAIHPWRCKNFLKKYWKYGCQNFLDMVLYKLAIVGQDWFPPPWIISKDGIYYVLIF
jgi:hypothetical protein